MTAWVINSLGLDSKIEPIEMPRPTPGPNEVLIRVGAVGVNPIDSKTRIGHGLSSGYPPLPWILGWDLCGTVVQRGEGATRFSEGDSVFGLVRFPLLGQTYASYVAVPEADLAVRAASLGVLEAAALPLAGLTAWQCLQRAGVQPGHRVLVLGGAGGVGHFVVGLALDQYCEVTATSSARHREFLESLGPVRWVASDSSEVLVAKEFDAIIDTVGDDAMKGLWGAVRSDGVVVRIVGGGTPQSLPESLRIIHHLVHPDAQGLDELQSRVISGRIRVDIESVLPLSQADVAHQRMQSGHGRGKTVLVP